MVRVAHCGHFSFSVYLPHDPHFLMFFKGGTFFAQNPVFCRYSLNHFVPDFDIGLPGSHYLQELLVELLLALLCV